MRGAPAADSETPGGRVARPMGRVASPCRDAVLPPARGAHLTPAASPWACLYVLSPTPGGRAQSSSCRSSPRPWGSRWLSPWRLADQAPCGDPSLHADEMGAVVSDRPADDSRPLPRQLQDFVRQLGCVATLQLSIRLLVMIAVFVSSLVLVDGLTSCGEDCMFTASIHDNLWCQVLFRKSSISIGFPANSSSCPLFLEDRTQFGDELLWRDSSIPDLPAKPMPHCRHYTGNLPDEELARFMPAEFPGALLKGGTITWFLVCSLNLISEALWAHSGNHDRVLCRCFAFAGLQWFPYLLLLPVVNIALHPLCPDLVLISHFTTLHAATIVCGCVIMFLWGATYFWGRSFLTEVSLYGGLFVLVLGVILLVFRLTFFPETTEGFANIYHLRWSGDPHGEQLFVVHVCIAAQIVMDMLGLFTLLACNCRRCKLRAVRPR